MSGKYQRKCTKCGVKHAPPTGAKCSMVYSESEQSMPSLEEGDSVNEMLNWAGCSGTGKQNTNYFDTNPNPYRLSPNGGHYEAEWPCLSKIDRTVKSEKQDAGGKVSHCLVPRTLHIRNDHKEDQDQPHMVPDIMEWYLILKSELIFYPSTYKARVIEDMTLQIQHVITGLYLTGHLIRELTVETIFHQALLQSMNPRAARLALLHLSGNHLWAGVIINLQIRGANVRRSR